MTRLLRLAPAIPYQRVLDLAFFLAVPLVLSLTMAFVGRYVDTMGFARGLLYVAALSFVPWWLAGLATQGANSLLRSRAPLWAIAAAGVVASVPFVALYSRAVALAFQAAATPAINWADVLRDMALSGGRAVALWTAFVLVFAGTLGWSRYGRAAGETQDQSPAPRARLQNSGAAWSADDDAQLAHLVTSGIEPRIIATRVGRTVAAVKARMKRLDLPRAK